MLTSHEDKNRSLEGELQGLKKDILSLEDIGELVRKSSNFKAKLFVLRVAILQLMERMNKELTLQAFGMPMMCGVDLPQIEVPTFDSTILNW